MGFLGITADVTGFSIDPPILIFSFLLASFVQVLKNSAEEEKKKEKFEEI